MIKMRMLTVVPLTIFYVCSTIIVLTRIINDSFYFHYYRAELDDHRSRAYEIGVKTGLVSSYFNLIMGFFQVASIFELFFVCGSIQKAALNSELSEAKPPSVVGIIITYLLASVASLACLGFLFYMMIKLNHNVVFERYDTLKNEVTSYIFVALCALLTLGVILLSWRLYKLKTIEASISDGKRALTVYYVIFMLGYMSRVGADVALDHYIEDPFIEEMIYDWCPLIWDGIPILCLLLFHF